MQGQPRLTPERAQADIDEFEFLLSFGMGIDAACMRLGLHPRTISRRYQLLGLPCPDGLRAAAERRYTRQVAP